ncbi:response regulator [Patescibacteria group bacterium]|nr:response regulator [Patescibacteria group bacterium]MBU1663364.1 response regulator [Patescibacteria group bacterium]MBU1934347.1 response regulator [Patescibacteria group bacterium]MBU2007606.1 response regulator [Patescibacteria group bacterium]MBU2233385.1 response regulator [Patescibacteria group bacterium]
MDKNKKIFIIENDANLLYSMQAKFRVENFEVIIDEGLDKIEIVEKIKIHRPDYIILDIILPKINGFQVLAEIKADPEILKILVFVFTNLSDDESRQKAMAMGADFYLIKTEFNLDEFVDKFQKIITNKAKIN